MKSLKDKKICGLILCAGSGSRTNLNYNKLFHIIGQKTLLELTLDKFLSSSCGRIMLAVNKNDYDASKLIASRYDGVELCIGGSSRSESVRNALKAITCCDIVVIHDGARPYLSPALIDKTIESAEEYGSGIAAVKSIDAIKEVNDSIIISSLDKSRLYNIQTPQAFRFNEISEAYNKISGDYQDDGEVYSLAGFKSRIVSGDYSNIKVTTPKDIFNLTPAGIRIGIGYDIHRLVLNRPLILGGVTIPHNLGLLGHSDADALTHAIADALLSAAGLPDIGVLFPDNDPKYKNADSVKLLKEVNGKIKAAGFKIKNISAVIIAQKPKLSGFIPDMRANLSNALEINTDLINISAKTAEGLGAVGEEKGIAVNASCLVYKE